VLRLTPAIAAKRGSAWFNVQQPVSGGFTTVFTFQFTQGSLPPADGIAFVIQNSALSALGQTGGSIGYADGATCDGETCVNSGGGIPNSLAVEFDTFDNGAATDDPNANHIGIQSCGIVGGVPQPNSPATAKTALAFPSAISRDRSLRCRPCPMAAFIRSRLTTNLPAVSATAALDS